MDLSPSALMAHARTDAGKRALRYSATSVIAVGITQVLLLIFYRGLKYSATSANLSATMITSIPAFALNKYWVWGKRGRAHMRREVI
ncbi:MAG: GtrA family protein, partial [Aquihabitans sp.]